MLLSLCKFQSGIPHLGSGRLSMLSPSLSIEMLKHICEDFLTEVLGKNAMQWPLNEASTSGALTSYLESCNERL